jgi:hypothetical protein
MIANFWQDLRYGARRLGKNLQFTMGYRVARRHQLAINLSV